MVGWLCTSLVPQRLDEISSYSIFRSLSVKDQVTDEYEHSSPQKHEPLDEPQEVDKRFSRKRLENMLIKF
jgi:hypothetical protein